MSNLFFSKKTIKSTVDVLKNTALGLGMTLGLALPLAESTARAQQLAQASVTVAQPGSYSIKSRGNNGLANKEMRVKNRQESLKVYFVYPPENEFTVLKMQGPANFVVDFYPFLNKQDPKIRSGQNLEISVSYEINGIKQTINATTGISSYDLEIKGAGVHKALGIGIPIAIKGTVPEGTHELLITGPKGVFRVEYVERITNQTEQTEADKNIKQPTASVQTESIDNEHLMPLPTFIVSYENLSLARAHETENQNDINRASMSFSPLHSRRTALMLGVFGDYDNASVASADSFEGTVRFYSFGANAGLALASPKQSLLVSASGGARKMSAELDYDTETIAVDDNAWQPQLGLTLRYNYAETLRLNSEVSNSPLLPGQFNFALRLPISIVNGEALELENNLLYFQLLDPKVLASASGTDASFTSDRSDVINRTTLNLPFLDIGHRLLLQAIGGYEVEAMKRASLEHVGMAGLSARIRILGSELSLGGLYLTDGNFAVSALFDLLSNPYSFQANFIQFSPSKDKNLREISVHGEKHEGN